MDIKLKARFRLARKYTNLQLKAAGEMKAGKIDDYIQTLMNIERVRSEMRQLARA